MLRTNHDRQESSRLSFREQAFSWRMGKAADAPY
jgi:hypothetical protein